MNGNIGPGSYDAYKIEKKYFGNNQVGFMSN